MVIVVNTTNYSVSHSVDGKNTAKSYKNVHGRLEFIVNNVVGLTNNYKKMNSFVGAFFGFRYLRGITNHQSFRACL